MTAEGLKRHNPRIKAIAVEPLASPLLSGGKAGSHRIQGIGANFIPNNYHAEVVDEIIQVSDEAAMQAAPRATITAAALPIGESPLVAFLAINRHHPLSKNEGG